MECYVNDMWHLLSRGASTSELKHKILENDKEIGIENSRTDAELKDIIKKLLQLQPYVQKCKKILKKQCHSEFKRLKQIDDELNSDLEYADK